MSERIAPAVWSGLLAGLAEGELVKDLLAAANIDKHVLRAHLAASVQARAEWDAARERSADAFMDMALDCAMAETGKEHAPHARTRIDTLKWAARIRNPRLYGDKSTVDLNVRTVDLTRIIGDANARLAAAREIGAIVQGQVIRPALEAPAAESQELDALL
jgi:terminase small subunit-like protein